MFPVSLPHVPLRVAAAHIDLHQHIEGVDKYMPAAHAGVDELDVLGIDGSILGSYLLKLRLHFRFLLRFFQIVFPPGFQDVAWMPLDPQPAEGVLHHIPHDPVRRKELGGGGNTLLGYLHILFEQSENLILRLGIEFSELTSQRFRLGPLRHVEYRLSTILVNKVVNHIVPLREGDIHQQLGIVV